MVDLVQRKTDRLRLIHALFDAAGGSSKRDINVEPLRARLGIPDRDLGQAFDYLEGASLIERVHRLQGCPYPLVVQLTHAGIREAEEGLGYPNNPTEHLPPDVSVDRSVTQHFYGHVIGSAIQARSPGATQNVTTNGVDLEFVRDFLRFYEEHKAALHLNVEQAARSEAQIQAIRAQVDSQRPNWQVIRQGLATIRTVLEGVAGNLATEGLRALLRDIGV